MEQKTVVTLEVNQHASNTFHVAQWLQGEDRVLLTHPLAGNLLIKVNSSDLNLGTPRLKDSTERCIDYANSNRNLLDYMTCQDLDGLGMLFFVKRNLTPRQKNILSNVCGIIASIKFNDDLKAAITFVSNNQSSLDDFNRMWYNNFKYLFSLEKQVVSKKQKSSIFNIAGYVLAEMENPSVTK